MESTLRSFLLPCNHYIVLINQLVEYKQSKHITKISQVVRYSNCNSRYCIQSDSNLLRYYSKLAKIGCGFLKAMLQILNTKCNGTRKVPTERGRNGVKIKNYLTSHTYVRLTVTQETIRLPESPVGIDVKDQTIIAKTN